MLLATLQGNFIANGLTHFASIDQFYLAGYHNQILSGLYNGHWSLPRSGGTSDQLVNSASLMHVLEYDIDILSAASRRLTIIQRLKSSIGKPTLYQTNPVLSAIQCSIYKRPKELDRLEFDLYNVSSYACYSIYVSMLREATEFLIQLTQSNRFWLL